MTDTPKCDLCGREKVLARCTWSDELQRYTFEYWVCPATPDQHRIAELEKQAAESEAKVAELEVFIREAIDTHMEGRPAAALEILRLAVIEREESRKKGAEHDE